MPPRTQPPESRQGLVIGLVFFVMLSIILGVTTYFGYSGQQQALQRETKAGTDLESEKKLRSQDLLEIAVYKTAIGIAKKDDSEKIAADKGKPELEGAVKALKGLKWDPKTEERPAQSYIDALEANAKELSTLGTKLAQANTSRQNAEGELKAEKDEHAKNKDGLNQELATAQAKLKEVVDKHSAAFDQQVKMLQQRDAEVRTLTKAGSDAKEEYQRDLRNKDKAIRDLKLNADKLQEQIKPVVQLSSEPPKGKVLRLERTGSFAYVNLGSADRVKPQLTFSIFGAGSYKAEAQPKGALEVVNVLEPHLSMARITNVRDRNRDPILTGDLLYNPAWSPAMREHVAIAGIIDLAGDGQDSLADSIRNLREFMHNLEKQNIVVDAYVNLKDGSVQGEMTLKTNYLIVGDAPDLGSIGPLAKGSPEQERKNEIRNRQSEMQAEAARKGIGVVPVRRFANLIGYRLPVTARDEYSGSSSSVPASELTGPAERGKAPAKKDKAGKAKPAKEKGPEDEPDKEQDK